MRRLSIAFGLLLSACGGTEEPSAADKKPALPGPDLVGSECTLLGAGCARALEYQMCCLGTVCTFTFSDGVAFATIDEALAYCKEGLAPAGSTPLMPAEGGGFENPEDETRDQVGPDGQPIGSGGGSGGPSSGNQNGSGSSSNQSSSGGACYGSVQACQARVGPSNCRENPGCYYEFEGCFGTSWACQSFYSPSQCGFQLGCRWDHYYDQCVGAAASCTGRSSSGSCHGLRGCYWEDAVCSGGAWQCNRYTTESGCRSMAGCYWR